MKFAELTVLFPCHSLEDFPLHYQAEEAEGLLGAWSAAWHPALIATAEKTPAWCQADAPPELRPGRLVIVPPAAEAMVPHSFLTAAPTDGACLIRHLANRPAVLAEALAPLDGAAPVVPPELVADFLALGTAYLQTELLTRRMRYLSHLEETRFQNAAVAAAQAAMRNDPDAAREALAQAFNRLAEARSHFYPVDAYLLDWTLVAPTTIGSALRAELARGVPINVFASAETIEVMAREQPATLAALRAALEAGQASLVGGEYHEQENPLLPVEAIRAQIERGLGVYQQHLGQRPTIFGRRRFGLTAALPQILHKFGFRGAIHTTLESGRMPRGERSKMSWEGLDGTTIDALGRAPLDARSSTSFLQLPETLGSTMDLDYVATVSFAHWPGDASAWYEDLLRATKYAPVLGKFVTLEEYFKATDSSESTTRFEPEEYRSPYLRQAVAARGVDPVARYVNYYRRHATADAAQAIATLAGVLGATPEDRAIPLPQELHQRGAEPAETDLANDAQLAAALDDAARELAGRISGQAASAERGTLVINPLSFTRRIAVETPDASQMPPIGGVVVGTHETHRRQVLVEVPPMGFAWFGAGQSAPRAKASRRTARPVAEDHVLRGEYVEVIIHPTSGGIQAIRDPGRRGNRLSQQLALRMVEVIDPEASDALEAHYTQMVADTVEVTAAGPWFGEITSRGRLVDPTGQDVAAFRQTVGLWRGERIVSLQIELVPSELPAGDPWQNYYAARFAWSDESAELRSSAAQVAYPASASRLEAPHFVEIQANDRRTSILSGGLPYHRRIGLRKLDTLLLVRGDTARRFNLAIGVEVPGQMAAALELLAPPVVVTGPPPAGGASSGWLFHLSRRTVVATHWEPIVAQGRVEGVRARLLETEGRPGRVILRSFRPPKSARLVDFENRPQGDLQIEGDGVRLDFAEYEWLEVEIQW